MIIRICTLIILYDPNKRYVKFNVLHVKTISVLSEGIIIFPYKSNKAKDLKITHL